ISSLALYGGSGDGYGSLPTDFGVVVGTKKGKKGVCDLGEKGEGYRGVQYFESGQGNMFWVLATLVPRVIKVLQECLRDERDDEYVTMIRKEKNMESRLDNSVPIGVVLFRHVVEADVIVEGSLFHP
nr:hypothetical protein [Tanacetum cinerariifolium]